MRISSALTTLPLPLTRLGFPSLDLRMEMHLSRPAGALGYSYADPLADGVVRDDPFLKLLLTTRAVRRLKSIRFLGGIDYVLVPWPNASGRNKRYTRHQHSLGVTRLAALYSAEQQLSEHEFRVVCAAALLHDVGHAPLSHSLEPIFYEYFGVEHHRTSEDIICGRVPIGRDVYNYLRAYHVDVEHVAALATGRESGFHDFWRPNQFRHYRSNPTMPRNGGTRRALANP